MPEASSIVRDVDYFLEPIFVCVEDTIFQIPKQHLNYISIFATTFSLPPSQDGIEGVTEDNPLKLHQISKQDFKAFLKVLIPLQIPHSYSNIVMAEWISTLKLSTMYEVSALRDLAIRHLMNQLSPVDMMLLGSKYRVPQWFITGCTNLISRNQGPTKEEGLLLGMQLVVQIYGIRERSISFRAAGRPATQFDYQRIIRETFPDQIFE